MGLEQRDWQPQLTRRQCPQLLNSKIPGGFTQTPGGREDYSSYQMPETKFPPNNDKRGLSQICIYLKKKKKAI